MTGDRSADGTTFVVTLVAKPGSDGIHALRALLKVALRRFGLRCINLQEQQQAGEKPT